MVGGIEPDAVEGALNAANDIEDFSESAVALLQEKNRILKTGKKLST
jgi:hypothetical protein